MSRPADDPRIERVLVIKWSAMGDVVLATAVLDDLAAALPNARIDLNTLPAWAGLFAGDARLHQVLAIDIRQRGGTLQRGWQWLSTVAAGRYDLIVDLQTTDRSRLLLGLLTLAGRAGRYRIGNRPGWPYTHSAPLLPRDSTHPIERMRAGLAAAGFAAVAAHPRLHLDDAAGSRTRHLQQQHRLTPGRYALFYPGCQAAGHLKRWGAARYAELARLLVEGGHVERVGLIGGPDDRDECQAIAGLAADAVANLCGQTALHDIVLLASDARLQVANDTGTAHVAACANRPLLVLCGPTDPRRVRPFGPRVHSLEAGVPCRHCYRKTCHNQHRCMQELTPDWVLTAALATVDDA